MMILILGQQLYYYQNKKKPVLHRDRLFYLPRRSHLIYIHIIYGNHLRGILLIDVVCPPTLLGLGVDLGAAPSVVDEVVEMSHEQMNRIQNDKENIDLGLLYLNIIQESSELITEMRHILRSEAKMNE